MGVAQQERKTCIDQDNDCNRARSGVKRTKERDQIDKLSTFIIYEFNI